MFYIFKSLQLFIFVWKSGGKLFYCISWQFYTKTGLLFYGCHGNGDDIMILIMKNQTICNKILRKLPKFGGKRTKTLGVTNRFMVGGTLCRAPLAL